MAHGKFGNLECTVAVAHCGYQLAGHDETAGGINLGHALLEAILHCLDDLVEAQATLQVLLWSPANLTIDDSVIGEVEHKFASYAGQGILGLHNRDSHIEGL